MPGWQDQIKGWAGGGGGGGGYGKTMGGGGGGRRQAIAEGFDATVQGRKAAYLQTFNKSWCQNSRKCNRPIWW